MTKFNKKRLDDKLFQIDDRVKMGWFTDEYLNNNVRILSTLAKEGYKFGDNESDLSQVDTTDVENGNLEVEMQFFTRRKPFSVVVGVDEALSILKECTGYYENGEFINTYKDIKIEAVEDGTIVEYSGNPSEVKPVLKIRGRYRDFAHLETVLLGVMSEPTRIATNVYNTFVAANGKDILFFPARFAHYKMQGIHGYAHKVAVECYNNTHKKKLHPFVSTNEQGSWWGGKGGGTVAHATIASFLGNTAETMLQFSRIMPVEILRIVLIDFHNDCVNETLGVMKKMFDKYWQYYSKGQLEEAKKYKLYGVRPDTSSNMIDKSIKYPSSEEDFGVNPKLIWNLRSSIDTAYIDWAKEFTKEEVKQGKLEILKEWCKSIKIIVTGGFDAKKIKYFEKFKVPVDIYGVGSSLLKNDKESNNDYTADVVRVKIHNEWYDLAKEGRNVCYNEELIEVK
ncbi:nicotinate phosphoribosyltransferase [Clostridiaceae bacterium M8S5]|nr:nicotinate phosphoribosyltransferase [Clostridiaceae bacterium M8S5]